MKIINLSNILDALQDIVEQNLGIYPGHPEINTFGWGDLSDINTISINGILMYVLPVSKSIETQNTSIFNIDLFFLDVIDVNVDNRKNILSNTFDVSSDIIRKLSSSKFRKDFDWYVSSSTSPEIFMDAEQRCLGVHSIISIEVYDGPSCNTNI